MNLEPRQKTDYKDRQVKAAHRVLVDLGQVLASFADCLVVVGGWTPDLLMPDAEEPHVGSIDVDLALDAAKLGSGRYAEMLKLLLDTRRYRLGDKDFQLTVEVDLGDGDRSVLVEVDFLAAKDVKLKKNKPKLVPGFRVLQVEACEVAFHAPLQLNLDGHNVRGAANKVNLRVISVADFLVMKAYALRGRDKPKDAYDLCYCLEHCPAGIKALAEDWKPRLRQPEVTQAMEILKEKFATVNSLGPQQLVEFHADADQDTLDMHARRAFELVQRFLSLLQSA